MTLTGDQLGWQEIVIGRGSQCRFPWIGQPSRHQITLADQLTRSLHCRKGPGEGLPGYPVGSGQGGR